MCSQIVKENIKFAYYFDYKTVFPDLFQLTRTDIRMLGSEEHGWCLRTLREL